MSRKSRKRNRSARSRAQAAVAQNSGRAAINPAVHMTGAETEPIVTYDLTITLKSDLCAGSGDGFSSGIDQDVCYDACGLPYIPGRRIKGCLREAAGDIAVPPDVIDVLFGVAGSSRSGALAISDAVLTDGMADGGVSSTIERYTYTRAQTKINRATGSAADNTLRFVRVVKHYQPNGQEMTFVARVALDQRNLTDREASYEARRQLERCTVAMRNLGMERNRGLGAVRCVLRRNSADMATKQQIYGSNADLLYVKNNDDNTVSISYVIRLDGPMMLPLQSGNRTHACIPGTSVMGFFASRLKGRDDFDDVFFGSDVRFSPLYPLDSPALSGKRCLPASSVLAKIKGGIREGLICRSDTFEAGTLEACKPLKDGFMSPESWQPVTVNTETIYHHSTWSLGTPDGEGTLYTQECLSAGQMMAGFIECPHKHADTLIGVLAQGRLSFGRSKSAQYGQCVLMRCNRDYSECGTKINIEKDEDYAVLLESDVILVGDSASSEATCDGLVRTLRNEGVVGVWLQCCDVDDPNRRTFVTNLPVHAVGGYNAKWNQKRAHVRALSAGGCIAFKAASTQAGVPAIGYVGIRQAEGYGRVRLLRLSDIKPAMTEAVETKSETDTHERARLIALAYADEVRKVYFAGQKPFGSSFVSRLLMMVDEAQESPSRTFSRDLDERIASVKDDEKRRHAEALVKNLRNRMESLDGLKGNWQMEKECLLFVLTLGKYFLKQVGATQGGER